MHRLSRQQNGEPQQDWETYPLIALDIELVEGDMRSGDQNFFDEWIDSLEHGEIEHFGAMLIQIGH